MLGRQGNPQCWLDQEDEQINTAVSSLCTLDSPCKLLLVHFDTVNHKVYSNATNVYIGVYSVQYTAVLVWSIMYLGEVSGLEEEEECPQKAPPVEIPQAYSPLLSVL